MKQIGRIFSHTIRRAVGILFRALGIIDIMYSHLLYQRHNSPIYHFKLFCLEQSVISSLKSSFSKSAPSKWESWRRYISHVIIRKNKNLQQCLQLCRKRMGAHPATSSWAESNPLPNTCSVILEHHHKTVPLAYHSDSDGQGIVHQLCRCCSVGDWREEILSGRIETERVFTSTRVI